MKAIKYIIYSVLFLLFFPLAGCTDDTFDNFNGDYPEGLANVQVTMDFEPFAVRSLNTRGVSGDVLDKLDDLCIVAYDREGNLLEGFPREITEADNNLTQNLVDRYDIDASGGTKAEDKTWQAKFNIQLPYGRYYIYGVANLGRYQGATRVSRTIDELKTGGKYAGVVGDRKKFLAARTSWDPDNYRNNGELLGFFTDGRQNSPSTGMQTNEKTVDINRPGMTLHCWLRRCASKVTIDFDGSALNDKVTIYVKRATIHDIPDGCALGMPNTANETDPKIISYKDADNRPDNLGDHIDYGSGDVYTKWPAITRQSPYIMEGGKRKQFHNYNSESLFLYENMQGDTENDKTNKEQHVNSDGTVVGFNDQKDNVDYGSYIEVEAYYERQRANNEKSQGKLIYRFMLGKDTKKNFDVERNYHYKITLCPRGYGNDVDWHIEYIENNRFDYKDPYYVSYLYNHDSTIRFRYTPPEGQTVTHIDAEIVGNNWWPDNTASSYSNAVAETQNPLKEDERDNPLKASFSRNRFTDAQGVSRTKYLGNGFLSLRATSATIITQEMTSDFVGLPYETDGFHQSKNKAGQSMNDNYFYGFQPKRKNDSEWVNTKDNSLIDRSRRTYYFNKPDPDNKGRERYEMQKLQDGAYMFNLPMFTRAKCLVKASGYTGNNPYEGSSRSAFVRLTVHLSGGGSDSQVIRVEQVPRITNPKGIYRSAKNNENFTVTLTERNGDNQPKFEELVSDGRWMAEVLSNDDNFINLNGRKSIKGNNSKVTFTVRFNKMNRDDKVRNAVIRVRYHNYSCVHLIFVRQGYSSIAIEESGTEWHTTNMVYDGVDAEDPRDEGSLFKFGNLTRPIDVNCNYYPGVTIGLYATASDFGGRSLYDIATNDITKYEANKYSWSNIGSNTSGFGNASGVAEMKNFSDLYTNSHVEQGYGVLYADGATTTQMDVTEAFGYCRHDPMTVKDKRGMLGVLVYYWDRDNGRNPYNFRSIFLPIGRSGYGHRKQNDNSGAGTLRYAANKRNETFPESLLPWEPLFYDLFRRKGAVYYARTIVSIKDVNGIMYDNSIGLDMNFFSFDFNLISSPDAGSGMDACFLRRVGKQTITTRSRRR